MEPKFTGEPRRSPDPAGTTPWTANSTAPPSWADLYVMPVWSHLLSWFGMAIVLVGLGYTGRTLASGIMLPGLLCILIVTLTTTRRLAAIWRQAVPSGTRAPGDLGRSVSLAVTTAAWVGFELFLSTTDASWWVIVLLAGAGALAIQTLNAVFTNARRAYLRALERQRWDQGA